ncbi:MAG: PIN domain-containing protein [Gemmatimonadota bacterium]
MRLFLDANIVFDVLAKREPWFAHSASVMSLLESDDVHGIVAAHSATTLCYLCSKHLGAERATTAIVDLLDLVTVAPIDQDAILKALALHWTDFEDALLALSAAEGAVDYLVTRISDDFRNASGPVASPSELLALLRASD